MSTEKEKPNKKRQNQGSAVTKRTTFGHFGRETRTAPGLRTTASAVLVCCWRSKETGRGTIPCSHRRCASVFPNRRAKKTEHEFLAPEQPLGVSGGCCCLGEITTPPPPQLPRAPARIDSPTSLTKTHQDQLFSLQITPIAAIS